MGRNNKAAAGKKTEQAPAENDPAENDSDTEAEPKTHQSCLTEDILKSHLLALEKRLTDSLGNAISALQDELELTKITADKALKLAEENQKAIEQLKNENLSLRTKLHTVEKEKLVNIEEQIENRTNRQLRKTLVFKGIPEKETSGNEVDSDSKSETWAQTEETLARTIAKTCEDTTIKEARGMLERCH